MYNLNIKLPHMVKSIKDFESVFNEDFVIKDSRSTDTKKETESYKKDTVLAAKELLLKSQLLASKQKEVKEVNEIHLLMNTILQEIDNYSKQRVDYLREILSQVSTLVMAIVEKIIHHKIDVDQTFIAQIVTNALKTANNEQDMVIQVNPDDKASLEKYWQEILKTQDRLAQIVLEENPGISKGGCVIKTANGSIDAQIENQLSVIEKLLINHYESVVYEHG